jgi:hypothetical protein
VSTYRGKKMNILHKGNVVISVGKRDALYPYWLDMHRAVVGAQKLIFL